MAKRDVIRRTVDGYGRLAAFRKVSGSWYRLHGEVGTAFNLQKFEHRPQYFLNVGFYLPEVHGFSFPREPDWDVRGRVERLLPDAEEEITSLLDLEHDIPDAERAAALERLLRERLEPLLRRGSSRAGLAELHATGMLIGCGLRTTALDALGVAYDAPRQPTTTPGTPERVRAIADGLRADLRDVGEPFSIAVVDPYGEHDEPLLTMVPGGLIGYGPRLPAILVRQRGGATMLMLFSDGDITGQVMDGIDQLQDVVAEATTEQWPRCPCHDGWMAAVPHGDLFGWACPSSGEVLAELGRLSELDPPRR